MANGLESINHREPDGLKPDGKPWRILVADDSAVMRKMIVQVLKSEAYEIVAEVADGEEAVNKYKELKPDLVTMDINMPKLDGVAALKLIRDFDPDARIVMLTSESQKETVLNAVSLGAKNYIVKPPERTKVLEKVRLSIQGK